MLTLGISGGLDLVFENPYDIPKVFTHDGAAALVEDGRVVAAIEEERLNRIKHSNKFPVLSLRFCLDRRGASIGDVDRFAFYATREYCDTLLARLHLTRPAMVRRVDARTVVRERLEREFRCEIDPDRIVFVPHHKAHAVSAFALSGFDRSLILAIDGYGDFLSGLVALGRAPALEVIETFPQSKSLGVFYLEVIQFIGYGSFDEYKVMGLAPYGDPAKLRSVFAEFYELLPGGGYELRIDRIVPTLLGRIDVRKRGAPFTQQHKDLAAALQEALEKIVLHVLAHQQRTTGEHNLCLAGGVAHNCTMNGKILYSGLFDEVFVQPAAHDAGCALGAALSVSRDRGAPPPRARLEHVYLGTDVGDERRITRELSRWRSFIEFERSPNVTSRTAELLARGAVVGWVQGRSEFGPRALGNRSILADPRPAENKERINAIVKKREGYRPFAPSVLEEDAASLFEIPAGGASLPFMLFVVRVRAEQRARLGAITHVDGTARIQTVSKTMNPRYWELIHAFKSATGVPALLNTSFNNDVEPIVDSIEDAVVAFLTTGLDWLVVGDMIVRRSNPSLGDRLGLLISLPPYVELHRTRRFVDLRQITTERWIATSHDAKRRHPLSVDLDAALMGLQGEAPLSDVLSAVGATGEQLAALVAEVEELWSRRLIRLRPPGTNGDGVPLDTSRIGSEGS